MFRSLSQFSYKKISRNSCPTNVDHRNPTIGKSYLLSPTPIQGHAPPSKVLLFQQNVFVPYSPIILKTTRFEPNYSKRSLVDIWLRTYQEQNTGVSFSKGPTDRQKMIVSNRIQRLLKECKEVYQRIVCQSHIICSNI